MEVTKESCGKKTLLAVRTMATTSMPVHKIFIIIVTYNGEKHVDSFASGFSELPAGWRVVIVDNASQDGTVSKLRAEYSHFTVVEQRENIGFGRANNIGLRMALAEEADFILLLNQDAKISVESIQFLAEVHERHPECLIVSPIHLNITGDDLDEPFLHYCMPRVCPGLVADVFTARAKELYYSQLGNAAIWLLSRNCLEIIGGFNPLFHMYGEDDEYRDRVFYHGYMLGIIPSIFAFHTRENRTSDKYKYYFSGALYELLKPHQKLNYKYVGGMLLKGMLKEVIKCNIRRAASCIFFFISLLKMKKNIVAAKEQTKRKGATFL